MEMKDLIKQLLREGTFGDTSIDRDVNEKVYKIMSALGVSRNTELKEKLDFLSNPTQKISATDVRKQLSAITLLEILKDLIQKFDGSSSGFLFESFLAGLMGGSVIEGNRPSDIYVGNVEQKTLDFTKDGEFYQTKLYDQKSSGKILLKEWFNPSKKGEYGRSNKIIFGVKIGEGVTTEIKIFEVDVDSYVKNNIKFYQNKYDKSSYSKYYSLSVDNIELIPTGEQPEERPSKENINPKDYSVSKLKSKRDKWDKMYKPDYSVEFSIKDVVNEMAGSIKIGEIELNINALRKIGNNVTKVAKDAMESVYTSMRNFDEALVEMNTGIQSSTADGEGYFNPENDVEVSANRAQDKLDDLRDDFVKSTLALFGALGNQ
jgi:hypothetical protein